MRFPAFVVVVGAGLFTVAALVELGCSSDPASTPAGDAGPTDAAPATSNPDVGTPVVGGGGGDPKPDGATAIVDAGPHCDGAVGCDRVVFVSSLNVTGDLNGIAGADDLCKALAGESRLPRVKGKTFIAWVSAGSVTASSRLAHDDRVLIRTDGAEIAVGWSELVKANLPVPIVYDENGELAHQSTRAWTGTKEDGLSVGGNDCSGWAAATGKGGQGGINRKNGTWTNDLEGDCAQVAHIYCFEK